MKSVLTHSIDHRIRWWIGSWIHIVCELVNIITLTLYRPIWSVMWLDYCIDKACKKEELK